MAVAADRTLPWPLHPLHAVVLAGTNPLFLGALLIDLAYDKTFELQWANFAQWLIAGGLVFAAIALLWALVDMVRRDRRTGRGVYYFLVLLAVCVLAFVDSLVHARDAWATMPTGLVLSGIVFVLACIATWLGFAGRRVGGAP